MGFKHTSGGDMSTGGTWLSEPGTYHLIISDMQEEVTNRDGALVANAAFRVACSVCAGTVDNQLDKTTDITFFHPKSTDKNEGAMARKKMDRFFVAVGLMTQQQVESKAEVDIDLHDAVGRQFIAKLDKDKEGSKFLSLSFADIYHVDDPAVAAIPKSAGHLKLIEPALRLKKADAAASAAKKPEPAKQPAAATAPADSGDDFLGDV